MGAHGIIVGYPITIAVTINLFSLFKLGELGVLCVTSKANYAHYFVIDSLTMNSYLMTTVTWMSMTVCSYQFKEERTCRLLISHIWLSGHLFLSTVLGTALNHLDHHFNY